VCFGATETLHKEDGDIGEMNGYAGKILRLNLTKRQISTIPTSDYEQWGGGHGMGSAIFFDLVKDKTIDGFDPANVVTIMTSPLCGTLVPAAGGRTEVQGIGVQSYPIGWFTRSNFGGRFSAQLKYAGWDGIVIEGRAEEPVWVDIRDGDVQLRSCHDLSLWGRDAWECQEKIWDYVSGSGAYGDWIEPAGEGKGRTTQRPAVLAIGPAGENLSRLGCLVHDASNAAGQGGFGGVWGSKRLKAISVIGTGGIHIHDPQALLKARIRHGRSLKTRRAPRRSRVSACVACDQGCKGRYEDGLGNEATCEEWGFYWDAATPDIHRTAMDLLNRYGLNAFDMGRVVLSYMRYLQASGELGVCGAVRQNDRVSE
jgi:aldehyde:ferredoxin oxidoreductase